MPRPRSNSMEGFGSDSFLDVVCNVVGILILLVLVVGLRVKHAPPAEAAADVQGAAPEIALSAERHALEDLAAEATRQRNELAAADAQQKALAERLAAAQQQALAEKDKTRRLRETLNQSQQWVADLQAAVRGKQQQLQALLVALKSDRPQQAKVVKIENYPAPISHTVTGEEAHFQLQGGRIAHVPFKALVDRFKSDAKARVNRSPSSRRIEGEVGPIGHFMLRYALKQAGYGRFALERFSFVPQAKVLGQPLDEALAPGSQFRQVLASYDPNTATITLWIYPDSFNEYRALRQEIYTLGYTIAARPLPFGQLISGSPDGSRSAAQ